MLFLCGGCYGFFMRIINLKIKNYKVFRDLDLRELPPLAVFVGANGVGKSTLFDVFGFLRDSLNYNVRHALMLRGGIRQVRSRGQTGDVEIVLQFRIPVAGKERLVTYWLQIGEERGKPVVRREVLRYKRGAHGSAFHFLDFAMGEGYVVKNEDVFDEKDAELERESQSMGSPDILAIKGLGQFARFKAANALRQFVERWYVSDFQISAARPSGEVGCHEHLSSTGDNLPMVAQYLHEQHPEVFDKILGRMSRRVPGVGKVAPEVTQDGRVLLKFYDGAFEDPFIAKYVSDGTIKMFAYLVLLHDPVPHPMLCIEEPENQLYPHLLDRLLEEFRLYARRGGQLFLSTHSPSLLNEAEPEEVFWLVKKDGYTKAYNAAADADIAVLCDEGDKLGYLWEQNFFRGSHPDAAA